MPSPYGAGEIGGSVALGAALPVGGGGTTFLQRAGQAAKAGALIGAVQNPGDIQGEVSPLQLSKRAEGAAIGGVTGPLLQGVLEGGAGVLNKAGSVAGNLYKKIASTTSGTTEKTIETYAKNQKEIDALNKKYGGEFTTWADDLRSRLSGKIQESKTKINEGIANDLRSLPSEPVIPLDEVIGGLDSIKNRTDAKLYPEAHAQIKEIKRRVLSLSENGKVSAQKLQDIKKFLQDTAAGSYQNAGQIFQPGKQAQQAAKEGAREARIVLDKISPSIKEANSKLQKLHQYDKNLNKNLLTPGKPEGALVAAGTGANPRNAAMLAGVGNVAGVDILPEVQKFAAARTFGGAEALPAIETGKALARSALGGIGGSYAGEQTGIDPRLAGLAGAAIGSPLGVRNTIRAYNAIQRANPRLLEKTIMNPQLLQPLLQKRLRALEE